MKTKTPHLIKFTIVLISSIVIIIYANYSFLPELFLQTKPYQAEYNKNNINTAIVLQTILKPNARIAVFWAGSIPYYSGFYSVDLLGKSDKYIAHLPPHIDKNVWIGMNSIPGHNKFDLAYSILHYKPTYTQGLKWGEKHIYNLVPNYDTFYYPKLPIIPFILDTTSQDVQWSRIKK